MAVCPNADGACCPNGLATGVADCPNSEGVVDAAGWLKAGAAEEATGFQNGTAADDDVVGVPVCPNTGVTVVADDAWPNNEGADEDIVVVMAVDCPNANVVDDATAPCCPKGVAEEAAAAVWPNKDGADAAGATGWPKAVPVAEEGSACAWVKADDAAIRVAMAWPAVDVCCSSEGWATGDACPNGRAADVLDAAANTDAEPCPNTTALPPEEAGTVEPDCNS